MADVEPVEVAHRQHAPPQRPGERLSFPPRPSMVRLPPVSTLSRYVADPLPARLRWARCVILALSVLVVDMLLNLEDVLEAERSLLGAIRFLWLRLASVYLPYLLPVATFTGAFFVGRPARPQPRDHRDQGRRRLAARRADPRVHRLGLHRHPRPARQRDAHRAGLRGARQGHRRALAAASSSAPGRSGTTRVATSTTSAPRTRAATRCATSASSSATRTGAWCA